nr:DMT family transporter [uncultured Desulfobacter sp.]
MPLIGELIALTTVLCWTISVQFFEAASRRIGALAVNIIRIACALTFFSALLFFRNGWIFPFDFPVHAWIYLSLSGIIGFFMGDIFLFNALVALGPRLTLLIFSLSAPAAAVIGWIFLKEVYTPGQWAGMFVTLSGVAMVILEKPGTPPWGKTRRTANLKGVLFGIGAMLGQAIGYILSKKGMLVDDKYLDAFSATQIRALAAFVCFLLFFTLSRRWHVVASGIKDKKAVLMTATGALIGPFVGVSLSLMVLHYLTTGVASTFLSLTPVCIIPFSIYMHKESVSMRAFGGAVVAVVGIWLLMGT